MINVPPEWIKNTSSAVNRLFFRYTTPVIIKMIIINSIIKGNISTNRSKRVLVCASDTRIGLPKGEKEMSFGDGAAALLLGNERGIASIEGSHTVTDELVDVWRPCSGSAETARVAVAHVINEDDKKVGTRRLGDRSHGSAQANDTKREARRDLGCGNHLHELDVVHERNRDQAMKHIYMLQTTIWLSVGIVLSGSAFGVGLTA